MAKVLHEKFGIEKGLMTTVHAYTNDQRVQDLPHEDPYRARAAAHEHHPHHHRRREGGGRSDSRPQGQADRHRAARAGADRQRRRPHRVMTRDVTKEEVNAAMKAAAEGPLKGILDYTEDPIVSTDIIGDPHSSIFAADWTAGDGRQPAQGRELVRQRMGLQRAHRRPDREDRQIQIARCPLAA